MAGVQEAERSLELASAARRSFDVEGAVTHLSAAIRGLSAGGDVRRAAMACVDLGDVLANGMGNSTAARAWFARAAAMVEDLEPCVEQGWVAVAAMGCDVGDPDRLLACAELALDRARRFGDIDLETKALADGGLAHVQAGRVEQGMAMLDEAMALACGPADDQEVAGKSACSFFTACYYSADFERAASWADLLRARGLIGPEPGAPIFLSNHCDAVRATLLCELGRWSEAESLLERASADFTTLTGMPSWHADILLADLRIHQGRHADAEQLLLGREQTYEALLPWARLHLARGDHDLAAAAARRGLRTLGSDRLRALELLTVLVDAELARGDHDAATEACAELDRRLRDVDNPVLEARSARARARLLQATADPAAAIELLEAALDRLPEAASPCQRARLLVDLARLRDELGDRPAAALDATAAAAVLSRLDVVVPGADREVLDRLAGTRPSWAPAVVAELRRSGSWWDVVHDGTSVRIRSTKGLCYLAVLVADPGIERHVLDLVDRIEGVGDVDRRTLGDAGPVLDATARTAYRHRIEELRAACEDALEVGAFDRAEAMQAELDQLVAQLGQAFGLGGRDRRASSAVERARLNVTRAIRSAIGRIEDALPEAGAALDRHVRTGLYAAYEPVDGEVRWVTPGSFIGD